MWRVVVQGQKKKQRAQIRMLLHLVTSEVPEKEKKIPKVSKKAL